MTQSAVQPAAVPSSPDASSRERFGTSELLCVVSHYDLGVIRSVVDYPRGSRKSPKLLLKASTGNFLLKRRARGRDDPFKVAFCHALQMHLAEQQFPLPHLIGTRTENNSMLQLSDGVYELFEYINGQTYSQSLESTLDAGRVLGLYHKLLEGFQSQWQPPTGSYHRTSGVAKCLTSIGGKTPAVAATCAHLTEQYQASAEAADAFGLSSWPKQICHGDWHPGNMLFRDNHVVGVIDYDSARLLQRVIDVANGALQFSIVGGEDDVARWPDHVDETRFRRFLRGYDQVQLLTEAELKAIGPLMCEALIAEAAFPIAATGRFGRIDGAAFLEMVARKIAWLNANLPRIVASVES